LDRKEDLKPCPWCQGSGFLYDMMLNESPCYRCKGRKVVNNEDKDID